MQTKPTRQSRGINAAERRHMAWIKGRMLCAACGQDGPVINHHCMGAMFKNNKIHCGHLFVNGLCKVCDDLVGDNRRAFRNVYGPQSEVWLKQFQDYPNKHEFSEEEVNAIISYGK